MHIPFRFHLLIYSINRPLIVHESPGGHGEAQGHRPLAEGLDWWPPSRRENTWGQLIWDIYIYKYIYIYIYIYIYNQQWDSGNIELSIYIYTHTYIYINKQQLGAVGVSFMAIAMVITSMRRDITW